MENRQENSSQPVEDSGLFSLLTIRAAFAGGLGSPQLMEFMARELGLAKQSSGPWTEEEFITAKIEAKERGIVERSRFVWQTIQELCEQLSELGGEFQNETSLLTQSSQQILSTIETYRYAVRAIFEEMPPESFLTEWRIAQFLSFVAYSFDRDMKSNFDLSNWIRRSNLQARYEAYTSGAMDYE